MGSGGSHPPAVEHCNFAGITPNHHRKWVVADRIRPPSSTSTCWNHTRPPWSMRRGGQ